MEYQRLGDYIREVNLRNRELKVTKPMGINIDKRFMPSVANVIGTDLSAYKMVCKNQFACNLMHVGRDEKIPIAMHTDDNPIIVSPAYFVFEIIPVETHGRASLHNDNELLPEYLMMWFRRAEFDRNAWFYTDADVRGGMDKKALMDMRLPVPTLARQREIVAEYETLGRRIRLNEQMIAKLEETAQALYRKMFVEGVDKENLPEGWKLGKLGDFGDVVTGKTPSTLDENNFGNYMPFVTIPDMHNGFFVIKTERGLSKKGVALQANKTIPKNSVCVSCIGTSGLVVVNPQECQTNQQINTIVPHNEYALEYIYLTCCGLEKIIAEYGMGAAVFNNLNKSEFENLRVIVPLDLEMQKFHEQVSPVFSAIYLKQQENEKLTELQSLLLARIRK